MSRAYLPWLKLHGEVCTDPDLTAMPLDQQAVFFRLLAYASSQSERGSVPADNLPKLSRWVANGQLDVLQRTLDYLMNDWQTIELRDGRYHFRNWSKYQRNYSDTPEAVEERKEKRADSYKEEDRANTPESKNRTAQNGEEQPLRVKREEERDRERVKTREGEDEKHSPLAALEAEERSEVEEIAGLLLIPLTDETKLRSIIHTYRKYAPVDTLALAYDYATWQEDEIASKNAGKKSANVHTSRVNGWSRQVTSKCKWEKYRRDIQVRLLRDVSRENGDSVQETPATPEQEQYIQQVYESIGYVPTRYYADGTVATVGADA